METKMQKNRKKKFLFVCLFVLFVKKKKIENVSTNFFRVFNFEGFTWGAGVYGAKIFIEEFCMYFCLDSPK